jgi:hypothetical protein
MDTRTFSIIGIMKYVIAFPVTDKELNARMFCTNLYSVVPACPTV